jgi:membrane dipeptidase
MNRREFSRLLAAGSAAAMMPMPYLLSEVPSQPAVSKQATELYQRVLVLDANSAPPIGDFPLPKASLDLVRDSGVNVVKVSLGGINAGFEDTVEEIAYVQQMIELYPDSFLQVRVADDMERARREKKLGIIFSFESADMLAGKIDNLEIFRHLGARVMQLSYNRKSPFAAGVMEPDGGGLTALGRDAVKKMNTLGITIDLSHANAQTTSDTIALSAKPVVMTHAGCVAVHPHPRNKTDEQMRALAGKGGVMGIYDLPYLAASPKQPTVDDYMAHMEHALQVMGEDHVGVGSDVGIDPFDTSPAGMEQFRKSEEQRQKAGLAAPEEDRPTYVVGLNIPRRIELIADRLLKGGYPERAVEKVIGGNFARVLRETWAG